MQTFVITTNLAFGFIAVFHLAYLGLMFDSSSEQDQVWFKTYFTTVNIMFNFLKSNVIRQKKLHVYFSGTACVTFNPTSKILFYLKKCSRQIKLIFLP